MRRHRHLELRQCRPERAAARHRAARGHRGRPGALVDETEDAPAPGVTEGRLHLWIYKGVGILKNNVKILAKDYYLASSVNKIKTYTYNEENDKMEDGEELVRGSKVKSYDKSKIIDDITYIETKIDDKVYYIFLFVKK